MTAGPFVMTNLEGLFSPLRDLEREMDELRTMRRVSQIWREMERREQGAWMMFGRFFDRQMDEMNRMTCAAWDTGLFARPQGNRFNHSFCGGGSPSDKNQGNVIVEFPDDKEIKITLEEPSVIITEVEDTPEESSPTAETADSSGAPRNSSPVKKSSLVIHENDYSVSEPGAKSSSSQVTSVSNSQVERKHSVDSNKTEKIEKRLKKVDFSRMEVHFEPGSGKVNIIETNEKPPSNQLFRRKRRHRERTRSESPQLDFVGSSGNEPFENTSSGSVRCASGFSTSDMNSNMEFTRLRNDLDLSIFNLRNTLFKNSINGFLTPAKSKNVLNSVDNLQENENIYRHSKINNFSSTEKILSDKNSSADRKSYLRSPFNVSSKLQDMIQKSVQNQIKIDNKHVDGIKDINVDKVEKQSDKCQKLTRNSLSPCSTLKGRTSSLKRSNSKGKDPLVGENSSSAMQRNNSKQSVNDDKSINKSKSVIRGDSFKKSSRVLRQESLRSTSSRGSINTETRLCQKKNNLKDSLKKDSNNKVNRTPSFGRIATNSLKKGGIYVDGRPRKTKGATVTVICYSSGPKQNDPSGKNNCNNITVNNQCVSKNRVLRKDSLKSYCSKESLSLLPNKNANKKNEFKDSCLGNDMNKENLCVPLEQTSGSKSNCGPSEYSRLNFTGRVSYNSICSKNAIYRNIPIYKDDSFNNNSNISTTESIGSGVKRIGRIDSDIKSENDTNLKTGSFKMDKQFNHQDSSLFQPIKKEKTIHSAKNQVNEIKTPVAIRKKSNYSESKRLTPSKEKNDLNEFKKSSVDKSSSGKSDHIKFTKSPSSKLSLTSLRRSKEPLRSFEKISNGWVGRCNMSATGRDSKSETKWSSSRIAEIKITSRMSNMSEKSRSSTGAGGSTSPASQASLGSRITEHRQREAMMRLTRGYPSTKLDYPSTSYLKQNIETRKRSRNVYTPSSLSSQSSNLPVTSKRRPAQYVRTESIRSDTPVPSEPIYETLNCRRKAPTPSALVKRNRHSNPCCNI